MADRNLEAQISVEFNTASSRQSLDSGDDIKDLFGKTKKWLEDLDASAFSDSLNADVIVSETEPEKRENKDLVWINLGEEKILIPEVKDDEVSMTDTWSSYKINSEIFNKTITIDDTLSDSSKNAVQNKVIKEAIDKKVDAVDGKGLSTNDYTTAEKTKLEGIADGATAVSEATVSGWGFTKNVGTYVKPETGIPASDLASNVIPTALPASDVKAWAKADSKPEYAWNEITDKPETFAPSAHNHDDRYYTEGEMDTKLSGKSDTGHTHTKSDITDFPTSLPASDVKAWAKADEKPTYTASEVGALANTVTHLSGDIATTEKGAANGVATLGSDGKIPSGQLPSYVDDVLEYAKKSDFPVNGESGKIYVDKDTNLAWRWSGSDYTEISPSLALGETSSTAYAGDKGKALADKLAGIAAGAEVNVQSDWNVTDTTSDAYIKNKPTIPSAVTESTVSGWGFTKNTGTYSKPSTGIPKTDLASAVQTSLGKADTALQSHQDISGKLDKSGGTMTGLLKWSGESALPNATSAEYMLTIDSFANGGTTKWIRTDNVTVGNSKKVNNHTVDKDVPSNAVFTDTWRGIQNNLTSDSTTESLSAAQGKALKALIDGKADKSAIPTIDTALSSTSTNPVQNKVIKAAFDNKADNAKLYTVDISASETWTAGTNCKYITKTVTGLATTDNIIISPSLSSDAAAAKLQLDAYKLILNGKITVSAGAITIQCYGDTPSTALTLNVLATY